uniref:Uncharacterized protein n=1 Tax=viral metagenome TaxID=1070528 RepID=A0A6M3X4X0_9ZZZZ
MTLENYVKLTRDMEKVLKFKPESFRVETREITDTVTKKPRTVHAATVDVIEEDGAPVTKTYNTLSEKHATQLKTAHDNGTLYRYRVGITVKGEGFAREYQIRFF